MGIRFWGGPVGVLALLLSSPALTAPAASDQASSPVRDEFVAAMQRVRQHVADQPDSPALQHYVIYDYLLAARLRRDLVSSSSDDLDTRVDAFLHAHAGQPVSRALRNEWLASLATRQRWDWFLPRAVDLNTSQLICDRLAGRLATNDTEGLSTEALARWSLPQRPPEECNPVFAWLRSQGFLTSALAENRTRAALAAENPRLAREFADDVPPAALPPLLEWARLLEAPKAALTELAQNGAMPVEPAALEAGFSRLSRTDAADALSLLPSLLARSDMTPALRAKLQRMAALGAAYGRDPGAIAAFERLPADAVDGDVREWRVRAALWAGDYAKARTWIEEMPASLATQPRWRYWRARTIEATENSEAAAPLFNEIAGLRDFYGYLAADRLHKDYALNAHPSANVEAEQKALAATPGLIRAHALFDCSMTDDAIAEWTAALATAEPAVKVQAAHLAARWGWYTQSIETLAQVGELDDVRLRYPRPYSSAVTEATRLTQLPPDWILAVMRQESLFRGDAVSRAGARGLMQLVPSTAQAVERRWHLPPPQRSLPFDATSDVTLGAAYLKELLDRYGGALGVSLAAYNAGPIPVARWLPPRSMPADVWIENIPYGETRTYIQRVFEHIVAFAWVRDAQPPRITSLLPEIDPTVATAQRAPNTSRVRSSSKKLQRLGQNSVKSRGAITGRE
ncbi:MAG TPA: transglycosylase SLT domain-containing protein [Steroidobacteraceae bacterium]|nr:transglycosylase SLT domain-containing protein [Steroidobacteraceae bacterium]